MKLFGAKNKRQAEQKPSQPQNNAPKKEQSKGGMTK